MNSVRVQLCLVVYDFTHTPKASYDLQAKNSEYTTSAVIFLFKTNNLQYILEPIPLRRYYCLHVCASIDLSIKQCLSSQLKEL